MKVSQSNQLRLVSRELRQIFQPAPMKISLGLCPRTFTTSQRYFTPANRILDPIRIPPTFHDYLRSCSANNTLMLTLFTTSACTPCRTITPLLTKLVQSRSPNPMDRYSSLAFTELELDSPDSSNGSMMDMGVLWGITSLPTLVGFGGRRADRVTERIMDTSLMSDEKRMGAWIDEQMSKGDPHGTEGGQGKGLFARLFG